MKKIAYFAKLIHLSMFGVSPTPIYINTYMNSFYIYAIPNLYIECHNVWSK